MFSAVQRKIPAFQKNSPLDRNISAISEFGFSVNDFTLLNPRLVGAGHALLDIAVAGVWYVGWIPSVRRRFPFSTKFSPSSIASRKALSLSTRWSDGRVTIEALGSMAYMWWAAQQMQGAVLRRAGSRSIV